MIINPFNAVRLLLASISLIYLTETPIIEEIELKENIQKLLLDSIFFHYNGLEVTEEIYLDY